jgi:hypothetical protein
MFYELAMELINSILLAELVLESIFLTHTEIAGRIVIDF